MNENAKKELANLLRGANLRPGSLEKKLAEADPEMRVLFEAAKKQHSIEIVLKGSSNGFGIRRKAELCFAKGYCDFERVPPGQFEIAVDGLNPVLWQGALTASQLCLDTESKPLKMAAASEATVFTTPSMSVILHGGDVLMEVYPGIEAGTVRIKSARRE